MLHETNRLRNVEKIGEPEYVAIETIQKKTSRK